MLLAGLAGLFFLPAPWNVVAVTLAAIIEVGEVAFWMRFLRRYKVQTGAEGMIGERGEVLEPVGRDSGSVRVRGEIWTARSERPMDRGARARVVAVAGLSLLVEPDEVRSDHGKGPL
jgi:membrane-bound serine protease (ClpP class)